MDMEVTDGKRGKGDDIVHPCLCTISAVVQGLILLRFLHNVGHHQSVLCTTCVATWSHVEGRLGDSMSAISASGDAASSADDKLLVRNSMSDL